MTTAYGCCRCGCGKQTRIAPVNDKSKSWIKGRPLNYLRGHALHAEGRGRLETSPRWKGGRSISEHGYVLISTGHGKQQYEHILMAEAVIGRPLKHFGPGHPDNEVVHHVDGDKQRNVLSNFLFCTHQYHTQLHHRLEQSPAWPEFPKVVRNQRMAA